MHSTNYKQSHTYLSPSIINAITQTVTIGESCSTYTGNGEKVKKTNVLAMLTCKFMHT